MSERRGDPLRGKWRNLIAEGDFPDFCDPEDCPMNSTVSPHAVRALQEYSEILRKAAKDSPLVCFAIIYAAAGWSYAAIGKRFGVSRQAIEQLLRRRSKHCPELKALIKRSNGRKPWGSPHGDGDAA